MKTRGTSNSNERGSSKSRTVRKHWLLKTYAADRNVSGRELSRQASYIGEEFVYEKLPTCRCYRCGKLLTFDTLTVDRIVPGAKGGTYARNNIRPACAECNSFTGGSIRGNK